MGRGSIKENKSFYQQLRERAGLSAEKASELLFISDSQLRRYEDGKINVEIIPKMAEVYHAPEIYNYYCSTECPFGKKYISRVTIGDLSQVVIGLLDSLNCAEKRKNELISIVADGRISEDELQSFIKIQEDFDRISDMVDALRMWTETATLPGATDSGNGKD